MYCTLIHNLGAQTITFGPLISKVCLVNGPVIYRLELESMPMIQRLEGGSVVYWIKGWSMIQRLVEGRSVVQRLESGCVV